MPRHVAVIMDGNRRWARLRDLPVRSGYEAGVESLRKIVEICCKWGIKVLSVFAFSSDNWFRPKVSFVSMPCLSFNWSSFIAAHSFIHRIAGGSGIFDEFV